ncbi:unnamed protein product [Brassica napus]|uniref:(rape) hypothetical protein n=1 Tax=Brassica napus TaxID=3708 RepID=A0A817B8I3_BRANA|nr:unnamed protein product [Brassica napus]
MGVIVISTGPSALELYFCLIHLWEARTGSKGGALIGLERLIIDEQIPVHDNNDQAVFVLLGDAGRELTGKHASGLVDKYFEANGDLGPDHEMPACPTNFDRHHWSNT